MKIRMSLQEAYYRIKRSLGIDPNLPLAKLVIEFGSGTVPKVYIQAIPFDRVLELVEGIEQVMNVSVGDDCSIVTVPFEEKHNGG